MPQAGRRIFPQRSTAQHSVVDKTQNIDNAIIRHAEHDRVPRFVYPFRWIGNMIPAVPGMVHANSCSKRAQPLDAVTLWIVGEILHRLDEENGIALAADLVEP
jgi:hypothetical protein